MNRPLVVSAVRRHALKCSVETGRRFERVAESFVDEIHVEIERLTRNIRGQYAPAIHAVVDHESASFATGELMEQIRKDLDAMIGRLIQSKVQQHPSKGRTLQGNL